MKLIYAGTPEVAVPTLKALTSSGHEIVAVITRSAKPKGRGKTLIPSPVALWAAENNLTVIEADTLRKTEIQAQIQELNADLGVVVAYGAIIPQNVLDMPTNGWINLHFSQLPRWRGAAPVQRAIEAGDKETAVNIFQLEAGLDTGPVYYSRTVAIDSEITAGELLNDLAESGAADVVNVVNNIASGTAKSTPQDEAGATYAHMLSKADLELNFHNSALEIHNRVRACAPTPGAYTTLPDGKRLKILRTRPADTPTLELKPGQLAVTKKQVWVGTGNGILELVTVAPAGKNPMEAAAWARGARLEADTTFKTGEDA